MGVHGLTTYLRENKRALSRTVQFSQNDEAKPSTPLVVDGWSLIYALYDESRRPWSFGGEYAHFYDDIQKLTRAWLSMGLKPYFVFDGPYPPLKHKTLIARASQSIIQPSILFFRTSPVSRSTARFMRENAILPPLCYTTTLAALRDLGEQVEIHIADEEGDPYMVELAGRLGGYVLGQDSDFVVLNAEGYLGYIPMDEMLWMVAAGGSSTGPAAVDDGFVVARPKGRGHRTTAPEATPGLFPPASGDPSSLQCSVYSPKALSTHLRLPLSLLPLVGALVGNDYTAERRPVNNIFFDRETTSAGRIARAAIVVASVLSSANTQKRQKRPVNSIMDVVELSVDALLVRAPPNFTSGERTTLIEKTVEATLQYAIPSRASDSDEGLWPTSSCALHLPAACPLVRYMSFPLSTDVEDEEVRPYRASVREQYVSAYRRGQLSPRILDILHTATAWPRHFLENPDLECVVRSIGRPLREYAYAVVEAGVGIPAPADDEDQGSTVNGSEADGSDGDELIDVVEEDSDDEEAEDPLAPLHGALQKLRLDSGMTTDSSAASQVTSANIFARRVVVTEYIRRGTRLADEQVAVPYLPRLLASLGGEDIFDAEISHPPSLWHEDSRLTLLLRILHSDNAAIRALSPAELIPVLAVRHVVQCLAKRASGAEASREREAEKWTQKEVRAFLAAFGPGDQDDSAYPDVLNRNVQLTAQVCAAMDALEMLVHTLLLADRVPSAAHLFSGRRFHAALISPGSPSVPDHIWDGALEGMESNFAQEREKKSKKDKKSVRPPAAATSGKKPASAQGRSVFSLLADVEA